MLLKNLQQSNKKLAWTHQERTILKAIDTDLELQQTQQMYFILSQNYKD